MHKRKKISQHLSYFVNLYILYFAVHLFDFAPGTSYKENYETFKLVVHRHYPLFSSSFVVCTLSVSNDFSNFTVFNQGCRDVILLFVAFARFIVSDPLVCR